MDRLTYPGVNSDETTVAITRVTEADLAVRSLVLGRSADGSACERPSDRYRTLADVRAGFG